MVEYDKYYKEENYFGKAYTGLIDYFKNYSEKGTVLDLGCGQGRDSLELAKLGYKVTGVDISVVGINNMLAESKRLNLDIIGLVEDIYTFSTINQYDIVLLDSMFHFYKNDREKETNFLIKILEEMKSSSVLCNLLLKSKSNEKYIKSIISKTLEGFTIYKDDYVDYTEANCEYHMYIIQKD